MIINFIKNNKCLKQINIQIIPRKGDLINISGQHFIVNSIELNLNNKCEYNVYIKRA